MSWAIFSQSLHNACYYCVNAYSLSENNTIVCFNNVTHAYNPKQTPLPHESMFFPTKYLGFTVLDMQFG